MTALTVHAEPDVRHSGAIDSVVASLPVSLAPSAGSADIVAVGGESGWPARAAAALEAGARGILVIEPTAADVDALAASAGDRPVVLDRAFAGNPGIAAATPAIAALDEAALLEARVTVPVAADLDAALLGQLALVRASGSPVVEARVVTRDTHGYTVRGRLADGRAALLTAVASDARASSAALRLIGATSAVEIELPTPAAARPARTTVSTAEGATLLPTEYETAHRATWRRLRDLLITGGTAADLDEFASDAALAASL
ncbi:hypothetical protein HQQ80_16600 [Microbacteriaceae bacterium VKM Ac-2855]|nr:hypothetical protein [Microbacteriaceae bacterium VKM Ac-2855]